MPSTRIFVMGMTSLLGSVVKAVVTSHPALVLVGESAVTDFDIAAASQPDIVVAAQDELTGAQVCAFLATHCRVGVLGLTTSSGRATLYEMRPQRTSLGEIGVADLADLLHRSRSVP